MTWVDWQTEQAAVWLTCVCCLLQAAAAEESLEIENARLRCELASQIALECARSALAGRDPSSTGSSPDRGTTSGAGGPSASGLLRSVSVPAVQGSVVGTGAWAAMPAQAGSVLVPGRGQAAQVRCIHPTGCLIMELVEGQLALRQPQAGQMCSGARQLLRCIICACS